MPENMPNQNENLNHYVCRGDRVPRLTKNQIHSLALIFADHLQISRGTPHRMTHLLDVELPSKFEGLDLEPVDNEEWETHWQGISRANYYPHNQTIKMKDDTYIKLYKGDPEAIKVFVHELGHFFLGHRKQPLHFSEQQPKPITQEEDSEWQADEFAEAFCKRMGIKYKERTMQLSLF